MKKIYQRIAAAALLAATAILPAGAADTYDVDGVKYVIESDTAVLVYELTNPEMTGTLTLPAKVTINGKSYTMRGIAGTAFKDCTGITSVVLPSCVDSIGVQAFNGCANLESINLGDTRLHWLSTSAFLYCGKLKSITIPATVVGMGINPFMESLSLTEINVAEGNPVLSSIDGVLFSKDKKTLIAFPAGKTKNYVVPDGTETIANSAFCMARKLRTVKFPESVTLIEGNAFMRVDSLEKIELPSKIREIGASAFAECKVAAGEIVLPSTLAKLSSKVFYYTAITSLEIPGTIKTIPGSLAQYCVKLRNLTLNEGTTSISSYAFNTTAISSIVIPNSVTTIKNSVFQGCTLLKNVTLGSGLSKIETQVFYKLTGLQQITIKATTPPTIADYTNYPAFTETVYANCNLFVPSGCIDAYKAATTWKNFTKISTSGVTDIETAEVAVSRSPYGITVIGGEGLTTEVYTLTGALVYAGTDAEIALPAGAVYIVKVGDKVFKIAI